MLDDNGFALYFRYRRQSDTGYIPFDQGVVSGLNEMIADSNSLGLTIFVAKNQSVPCKCSQFFPWVMFDAFWCDKTVVVIREQFYDLLPNLIFLSRPK